MKAALGAPGEREARLLAESGLSVEVLGRPPARLEGARRPLRFQPRAWSVDSGQDERGAFLRVRFTLDPGCYATTLLREICKAEEADSA